MSERKQKIRMNIHTGMLESLGVNMYTSIGQSLVEFVANAFDADANEVYVDIPFSDIADARLSLRAKQKKSGVDVGRGVYLPLPDSLRIQIRDDGHGMSEIELEDKFLSLSRNRRKYDSGKSESGKRHVMGRKGLGKLAGFGAAEHVHVWTKRKGENYSTSILMDFNEISSKEAVGEVEFSPVYEDAQNLEESGTVVTLKMLRCDAIKSSFETIWKTLSRNFSKLGDDFKIYLNNDLIVAPNVHYEFVYPKKEDGNADTLSPLDIKTEDDFSYPVLASVKFRARGESDNQFERGHLPAKERGARVYCNGRLAAGPSLFNLPTGMHNFHSQSYMECIVEADVLDQMEVDLISTNRQGFKTDNVIVDAFIEGITNFMKDAIREHGKFRDREAEIEIENDPGSQVILKSVRALDKKVQKPAQQILRTIAARDGTDSAVYKELAPHLVQAINSSEVLVELVKSGTSPKDLKTIIEQLAELSEIEKSDVMKLYRGRRNGIDGLQKLEEKAREKGPKYEKELHTLLKENPWLIRPEYGNYLTSDEKMGDVARKLNKKLRIDDQAGTNAIERPDLVFLTINAASPDEVMIVELKSPNVELNTDHLTQLEGYIAEVEAVLQQDYQGRQIRVAGHLIGNMARPDSQSTKAKTLASRIAKSGPSEQWEVISIPELLKRARSTHLQIIDAIEAEQDG